MLDQHVKQPDYYSQKYRALVAELSYMASSLAVASLQAPGAKSNFLIGQFGTAN